MIASSVIVDITFPRRSLVFGKSSCEVSACFSDVGGLAVAILDLSAACLFFGSFFSLALVVTNVV